MHGNLLATKRLMAILLLLSSFGFLSTFIGTLGPVWMVTDSGTNKWKLKEGIWLAQLCDVFGNDCKTSTRENILAELGFGVSRSQMPDIHWMEFQIFTIVSLIGGLVTVVIATVTVVRKSKQAISRPALSVCFFACLSSCFFLLVPVLKISSVSTEVFDGQAWSLWVATVGVFFQFITSCLLVFAVYHNCRHSFKHKAQLTIRRERSEVVMNYLISQRDNNNDTRGSQHGTSNRSNLPHLESSNRSNQSQLGISNKSNQSQLGTSNRRNQSQLGTSNRSNQSQLGTSNRSNRSQLGTSNRSNQSQLGTSNRSNQSESRDRDKSLTLRSLCDPLSYKYSTGSSVGVQVSHTNIHLPAYNEIVGPSSEYETV